MSGFLATVAKDLQRYARDPVALAMWLGIPLVIGSLLVLATGGSEGPAPRVHLLIADEDDSFGSRLLLGFCEQEQTGLTIRTEKVDRKAGRQRLDQGEASALLVIPEGFAEAVLKEEPTTLLLVTNPAQRIMPGIVEELLGLLRDAAFYAHRLLGSEIREMVDGPLDENDFFRDATIARMSISINQKMTRLDRYLSPPVIELETVKPKQEESEQPASPSVPFTFYFLPGMMLMGLLFTAQGLSEDVWKEREAGVLRRVVTTPLGISRFLAGKIAAAAVVLAIIATIVLCAGFWYFELPWARFPLALVWSVGIGVMLTGLMLSVQVLASSHRGASVLSYLVVFPLMMLGGSMFPFEIMPGWLAAIGRFTPNGWAVQQLKAVLLAEAGPLSLVAAFGLLFLFTAGFFAVAVARMIRGFARSF